MGLVRLADPVERKTTMRNMSIAAGMVLALMAGPAFAWMGEGDTTNPGEVAPGAKSFGHVGGKSDPTPGKLTFKFCGNLCGWNSNKGWSGEGGNRNSKGTKSNEGYCGGGNC